MKHKVFIKIIVVTVLILTAMSSVYAIAPKKIVPRPTPTPIADKKVALGMWTEGFYDAKTQALQPEKLLEFEALTEKKYAIAHYYRGWESFTDPTLLSEFKTIRANGWMPMLNANPYFFPACPPTGEVLYKAIANGACDDFLRDAGKNLRKVKEPFYLLFAWEMNNKDLEWSIPYSGGTAEDFVAAWRHVHDIFEKEKVHSIVWVFCPNIPNVPEYPYTSLYPGDSYVDWTCLDGYNWGTTQSWSQWADFAGVFTSAYTTMHEIAPDKPMMLGEVNTTDQGGDKAQWYRTMLLDQLPQNFPEIEAVVFFNENRPGEKVNWSIDISQESLEAFKEGVHSQYYE